MTTLDDRPTVADVEDPPDPGPSATATALADEDTYDASNAEACHTDTRVTRARARLMQILTALVSAVKRLVHVEVMVPSLLDARPRSLREQQDYIRQQQVGRPSPVAADTSKWRVFGEHVHDAGLWALFVVKCLAMTVEWCCESYKRFAVLVAVVVALIVTF
jgi:hypothetical protein